ncbi:VOC family protein [Nocardioides sp.]|uniref:VOC family protein n=1 Tax=Nocardioides sp. TaxID=35761 RepID=UPI002720438B|nr:VOC family protein [Nocardioides sp.]MDO9457006.1 VOC family protein [Nocardioides sp.]
MSDQQHHVHHAIDYVEITVTDLGRAKAFYAAAFGWSFNDYGPDYAGIRWSDGEGEVGGLGVGTPSGAGGVLVLLYSDDLDATVAAVDGAGGTAEAPYDFPGGRRFLFTDPDGNRLGAWTAA